MTFLMLGLDALDAKLVDEFGSFDDLPFEINELKQDLPEVIANGDDFDPTGFWTFYVWGAMASGQIDTPEQRQRHPTKDEVEFPLSYGKNIGTWIKNRLKGRPRYKSFAWDDFDNVKIINYPLHMPEYKRNCCFFRDDRISREYGPLELPMLVAEINDAIDKGYDAVFAVTRFTDCICHGATEPGNYDFEDWDEWLQDMKGKSFEEFHEAGKSFSDLENSDEFSDLKREDADELANKVTDRVKDAYDAVADKINGIKWGEVDNYVVVSDHGFSKLGCGSVKSHSPRAVLSSNFMEASTMSEFIQNWRQELNKEQNNKNTKKFKEKSEDERVKARLRDLGYLE